MASFEACVNAHPASFDEGTSSEVAKISGRGFKRGLKRGEL
jgi:hypothetical protein